ncbi:MAG: permease [Acidobacteria bacterium]|nr:MAG: permease [Acidobacteriota bacterium]
MGKYSGFLKTLGPGLLFAGAAVGVSHLVQSTRAGANYGFALVGLVLLTNMLKYPFFEFASRYTAGMGESLLHGYRRIGLWAVYLFLALTVLVMFTIQAAVTMVTAALATQLFNFGLDIFQWTTVLLMVCCLVLAVGKYALLDKMMKVIVVLLSLSTLAALVVAIANSGSTQHVNSETVLWNAAGISFMVALMGWMPSPIDVSVWNSLWAIEREKQTGHKPTVRQAIWDLNIGYMGTVFIALSFLSLGALVFYGSGETLSAKGTVFASQVIELYTANLGSWSKGFIATAAFSTMFSTTLTCLDAFPRVLTQTLQLLTSRKLGPRRSYWGSLAVVTAGTTVLLRGFTHQMTAMVDLATTLSFLTAPVLAFFNYKVVFSSWFPSASRPPAWLRLLSWAGMVFLTGFSLTFIYWRFLAG